MSNYTIQVVSRREVYDEIVAKVTSKLNEIHERNPRGYNDEIDMRIEIIATDVALEHGMKFEMVGRDLRFWDNDIKHPNFK